nr:alpha-N-arabinofuranosidase [Sphingomonas sp.]
MTMIRRFLFGLTIVAVLGADPAEATIHASATIDARAAGVRIAPEIYGQFSEQLGQGITDGIWVGEGSPIPNIHGYRRDVVEALQALHVPVLRWPGGCYADTYHWRDGIGPRARRPVTLNKWWGNNEEHNAFGTHEYFDFAELIGTRTFLNVNVGTGTAGEANDWVEYVSSPSNSALAQLRRANGRQQPWKIDYVGIGNEMWGCGGNLTAAQYAPLMRMFGTFIRQGPKVVAVGASADDYAWTEEMMKSADKMDVLGLHYYTLPTGDWSHKGAAVGFTKAEWLATFAQTRRMEEMIERHSAIMDKSDPAKKVALAVDEWGTWYDTPPGAPALRQENTLRDALVAATNFNIFHRHADRVRMTNIAQMVNVLQAMILTDGPRMVRTPTYYAFQMYRPFQGVTALPVAANSPNESAGMTQFPAVDVTAARGADGVVHVGIVNVDPDQPAEVEVDLPRSGGAISGQLLTAPAMDSRNRFGAAEEVRPVPFRNARWAGGKLHVAMPAKSIVVLSIK